MFTGPLALEPLIESKPPGLTTLAIQLPASVVVAVLVTKM